MDVIKGIIGIGIIVYLLHGLFTEGWRVLLHRFGAIAGIVVVAFLLLGYDIVFAAYTRHMKMHFISDLSSFALIFYAMVTALAGLFCSLVGLATVRLAWRGTVRPWLAACGIFTPLAAIYLAYNVPIFIGLATHKVTLYAPHLFWSITLPVLCLFPLAIAIAVQHLKRDASATLGNAVTPREQVAR